MAVIIYPPTIDWDFMRQRPQNLMWQFAKNGHQVFYCNKKQLAYPYLEKVDKNLHVVHNVDWFLENCLPQIKKSHVPVVVWCSWSLIAHTVKSYQPDVIIYDCLDEFVEWLPYEADMVHMADIIFCSSDYLIDRVTSQYPDKKIFLLKNGCEFKHFNFGANRAIPKRPVDLPTSKGSTIGYIGAWAWWADVELVMKICHRFRQHQVVVIGADLGARLPREFPNFKYLGLKKYEQLPDYLTHLDICIIPFKINQTTKATNPIKVYEYLAAGKNVIASALPELLNLQPLVKIGYNHDEFLALIEESLNNRYERINEKINFAKDNSWDKRYFIIEEVLKKEIAYFNNEVEYYGFEEQLALPDNGRFCCFFPTADATISSSRYEQNMDFDPILIGQCQGSKYQYLLRFDPKGIVGKIKKAIISVFIDRYGNPENTICLEVRKILTEWVENQVTWKTKPVISPVPAGKAYLNKISNWLEWDVTKLVKEWLAKPETNFGVLIKDAGLEKPSHIKGVNRHRGDAYSPKLKIYF